MRALGKNSAAGAAISDNLMILFARVKEARFLKGGRRPPISRRASLSLRVDKQGDAIKTPVMRKTAKEVGLNEARALSPAVSIVARSGPASANRLH